MEEQRPGEYLPVFENERGTYIFNSKDLCMIEHIPDLVQAGIDSLKIEGRMKTALYVATVARTYRRAIDDYCEDPALYEKIWTGTAVRYQTVLTVSLPLVSFTGNRMRILRSMTATRIFGITRFWELWRKRTRPDGVTFIRKTSFL